jgi:RHS repeat-associated protein
VLSRPEDWGIGKGLRDIGQPPKNGCRRLAELPSVSRVVSDTNGVVTTQSLLADHQGSISSVVTDSTGASLISESFTAYGSRREASTWSGAPTSAELATMNGVTREGYTFQTVLGSMDLNHMNGRIEDSVTGRFLSPDPRGTSPGNTQSWNRYSYVYNNPLTLVDPTGFYAKPCPADGGCSGGTYITPLTGTLIPGYIPDGWSCSGNCSLSALTGLSQGVIDQALGGSSTVGQGSSSSPTASGSNSTPVATQSQGQTQSQSPAQSPDASQSGCVGSPCLDQIEIDAPRYPGNLSPAFAPEKYFTCGSWTCGYQMGPWTPAPYNGVWFNLNIYGRRGSGGQWVQTFFTSGNFHADSNGGFWGPDYSSNTWFYDDPAGFSGQDKLWVAQTSYLVPGQTGAAFTIMWGYQIYSNGGVSTIPPVLAGPWASQQQLIQANPNP